MAELESPGQRDGGHHSRRGRRQGGWEFRSPSRPAPTERCRPHPAHEHDDECGEPPGAHHSGSVNWAETCSAERIEIQANFFTPIDQAKERVAASANH